MRNATGLSLLTLVVVACSSAPAQPSTPTRGMSPSIDARGSATAEAPSATASSASARPIGSADVLVSPDLQVVYTGDGVTIWTWAFAAGDKTTAPDPLDVATATITFGDGTSGSVSQPCTAPAARLRLRHVYSRAADYTLRVAGATLCQTGWQANLDGGEGIRVFPAAAPGTAAWPTCTTDQLNMTDGGSGAGLGNVETVIHLKNVSSSGCNLEGYADLQLVSPTGALLPTHVRDATDGDYMFAALKPARVALGRGEIASMEFGYGDNPTGDGKVPYDVACPPARSLRVTLPGTHEYAMAAVATAPCGGFVNVSPIYPGSSPIGFP